MKTIFILLNSVFLFFNVSAQNCDSIYKQSLLLFDNNKIEESIAEIQKVLQVCAEKEEYHLHAAKCYFQEKNYPATLKELNAAILINDKCVDAYGLKAHIYLEQDQFDEAILNYEKVISILPATDSFDIVFHINLSKAYNSVNKHNKTYTLLKSIYHIDSLSLEMNSNLAVACIYLNKLPEAEFYLKKCISINPKFSGNYTNLGYFYIESKNYDKALECFNKAISLEPNDAYAYNNRGFVYYELGNNTSALEDINKSITLDPSNSYAYKNRALVYIKTGLTTEACLDLEKAIKLGFTAMYGNEVIILKKEMCSKN